MLKKRAPAPGQTGRQNLDAAHGAPDLVAARADARVRRRGAGDVAGRNGFSGLLANVCRTVSGFSLALALLALPLPQPAAAQSGPVPCTIVSIATIVARCRNGPALSWAEGWLSPV